MTRERCVYSWNIALLFPFWTGITFAVLRDFLRNDWLMIYVNGVMIDSANILKALFVISSSPGDEWPLSSLIMPSTCFGSILWKNIEMGMGDLRYSVKFFSDFGSLFANFFPTEQKWLFRVSEIAEFSVTFALLQKSRLLRLGLSKSRGVSID